MQLALFAVFINFAPPPLFDPCPWNTCKHIQVYLPPLQCSGLCRHFITVKWFSYLQSFLASEKCKWSSLDQVSLIQLTSPSLKVHFTLLSMEISWQHFLWTCIHVCACVEIRGQPWVSSSGMLSTYGGLSLAWNSLIRLDCLASGP